MLKSKAPLSIAFLCLAALLSACSSIVQPTMTPAALATAVPAIVFPGFSAISPRQTLAQADGATDSAALGAPDWVKPGTRITFYSAAASVAQSRYTFVEDPNGNYTDPVSGKHYRRTDEGPDAQGITTASGDGFSQIDVLALEGKNVVLSMSLYGIDHINNQFVLASSGGAKVPGATIDGVWVHPQQLAALQKTGVAGVLLLLGDYKLGATVYKAISFVSSTSGSYLSYTYDTATGLLLAATTSTAGPGSPISMSNEPAPQGNTQLTITRFGGVRQRTMPGLSGANPSWVAQTSRLQYGGTYNFTNPVDPSSANMTFPATLSVQLQKGGRNWAPYTAQLQIQAPGFQTSTASGVTGSAGLYWIDPAALSKLKSGQLLDKDPLTGEQVTVRTVSSSGANKIVTIDTKLAGATTSATYDLTGGALTRYTIFTASNGTTMQFQLQGTPPR